MKTQTQLFILLLIVIGCLNAQKSDFKNQGDGMSRTGYIHRYENWVYPTNVLSEWKKDRGGIRPNSTTGLLSNPYRNDGTSLSYGVTIPNNFNGKIPIFTAGNWWPTIGTNQTAPLQYGDLDTDTGATYLNGVVIDNPTITRQGIDRITIVNNTPYSYLVSSGTFPGNEQPGQAMTIIHPNGSAQLPIPPKDWWEFTFNGQLISAVPEMYSSVAGLHPLDAPGWKHSSWSPKYQGGIQAKDFGTAGFAYTFGSLFGRNDGTYDLTEVLFAGFHTNEGYDPLVSGDPGYGCAFYINGELQAVMDISLTSTHSAEAILVAQTRHNPAPEQSAFSDEFSHLKSIIAVQPTETAELHYISHDTAKEFIQTFATNENWKKVEKLYQSNTLASVQDIPLPPIISSTPLPTDSCTDGIQNGDESGIDCGGDCSPCDTEINYVTGKFVIDGTGTLLGIGQDTNSIDAFSSAMNSIPAVVSGYTSINNLEGIDTEASYGTGVQHLSYLATTYPNSAIAVGVYLVDQLQNFNNGNLDTKMDTLIDKLVALDRPIYLRWGYEFDGPHNQYDPTQFITAWKKMYDRIKTKGADKNIAMVWHSGAFCGATFNNNPIASWYPGNTYVDLVGITVFTPQDCNYKAQNTVLNFARQENKPVIIAEATPQGYDLSDNTIAPLFGDNIGIKTPKTAQQIWEEWYQPFFGYISQNKDIIRVVTYINADWNSQGFWDAPYEMGYWGDSRIQSNDLIASNWSNHIDSSDWTKASNTLFTLIKYTKNNSNDTPNCSDGIQNGNETGIDCGGNCNPCETNPTCSDGIQNGNETGIDCGGNCNPCETNPTCNDGIQNGNETGIDCGGNCNPCETSSPIARCEEFGISYINDTTARVYHKDLGFKSNIFACIDTNCYAPKLENTYYYFDFNTTSTFSFVTMNLNQTYNIKFLADYTEVAKKSVVFTTTSCSFTNTRDAPIVNTFSISPNPSSDFIELTGHQISTNTRYRIYTLNGQLIKNGKGTTINISDLKKGIFLLKTDTLEHHLFVKN